MKPRAWPEGGRPIGIMDALEPLFAVLKASRRRSAATADLAAIYCEAGGLDLGHETKETSRDVTDEIAAPADGAEAIWDAVEARLLLVAFRLGVEQGRRIEVRSRAATADRALRLFDELEKRVANLAATISRLDGLQCQGIGERLRKTPNRELILAYLGKQPGDTVRHVFDWIRTIKPTTTVGTIQGEIWRMAKSGVLQGGGKHGSKRFRVAKGHTK